jgi:hypothetical protein
MGSAARGASCDANILRPVSCKTTDLVGEIVSVTTRHSTLNQRIQGFKALVH